MKRIAHIVIFCIISATMPAQDHGDTDVQDTTEAQEGIVQSLTLLKLALNDHAHFKLYETQNMWTFLELDTATGKMWQVQFSIKGEDYRFKIELNPYSLVYDGLENAGRFELQPTQNMYNFLLLDQTDGRTWQVQWSLDADKRTVIGIY